jgi:predicted metal-binding membrane protein
MSERSEIEQILAKDRLLISVAMFAIFLLAAVYTLMGIGMPMSAVEMTFGSNEMSMKDMSTGGMEQSVMNIPPKDTSEGGMSSMMMPAVWSVNYAALVFLMWWVMMIAMMLPSVASIILLYSTLIRRSNQAENPTTIASSFLGGYLAAWAFFSLLATLLQWVLELRGFVSPMEMLLTSQIISAGTLIAAGLYQFTPVKESCLKHCQNPMKFLSERRRPGTKGAFLMGIEHGAFCLGCCWFLMALLFVGGIMNLYWIIGLTLYVLFEKLIPTTHPINLGKIAGGILILVGIGIIGFGFIN